MKKFAWLMFVLFTLAVVVTTSSTVKNFVGSALGYGACPNCGNNWFWAESGNIWIRELEEGTDFSVTGGSDDHTTIIVGSGLMICKECLSDPDKLDANRIGDDLLNSEWGPEEVTRAKQAVNAFKKGLNVDPVAGVMETPI